MSSNITGSKEYRRDPMLRRCCWYVIASTPVMLFAVYRATQDPNHVGVKGVGLVLMMGFFAIPALLLTMPLFWKIRLDEKGISRRSFFRWDFWSWDDIASGRIIKSSSCSLYDPSRPVGHRSLTLHLSFKDYQEVMAAINEHFQLPSAPEIPESITVHPPLRHVATFDQTGIHRVVRKKKQNVLWEDVCDVHITRIEPLSRSFSQIVITLPDHELGNNEILIVRQMVPKPEELNELLLEKVSPDKIHISIVGQPLTKQRHIERHLKVVGSRRRALAIGVPIIMFLLTGLLVLMIHDSNLLKVCLLGSLTLPIMIVVLGIEYRTHCKEIYELKKSLDTINEN